MTSPHHARLRGCFKAVFPELSDGQINEVSMRTLGEWNSFALLRLLVAIQHEFKVVMSAAQMNQCTSFRAIVQVLAPMLEELAPRENPQSRTTS